MALLAALFLAFLVGAVESDGSASLWMQVALAALVLVQMIATGAMKILERRWAEEDRRRLATQLEASTVKVAAVAKDTRNELVAKLDEQTSMLSENTELTRRNGEQEQKIAAALSAFDRLLERLPATPPEAELSALRKTLYEGSQGGAETADRSPRPQ
jgi:ribosomal protein L16 Arg81 hydroxylase